MSVLRVLGLGLFLALAALTRPAFADWDQALADYEAGHFEAALAQLLPLAEAGNVDALEIVADMYSYGQGVKADRTEALKWSRRAAALGSAEGENDLGVAYSTGEGGLDKSDAESLRWFKLAAGHGNAKAQISLSRRYLYGTDGVEQDIGLGLQYLFAAADANNPRALSSLAQFTATGLFGLNADMREAVRLYERAAELRYAPAQVELAYAYGLGRGVARDRVKAAMWLTVAAKARCIRAAQVYEAWRRSSLLPGEVEAAQRMAEAWERAHPPAQRRNANDLQSASGCEPLSQFGSVGI